MVNYENYEKATRTQICEKFISEADRVSSLMAAIKMYCQQVIDGENCNQSDGFNSSESFFKTFVQAYAKSTQHNDFIQIDSCDGLLHDILKNYDKIVFPPEFFEEKKTQDDNLEHKAQETQDNSCCKDDKDCEITDEEKAFMSLCGAIALLLRGW